MGAEVIGAGLVAIRIPDEFGELLNEKNVTIPSSDREGREARLYGSECYSLEDAITNILVEETTGRKVGDDPALLDQ